MSLESAPFNVLSSAAKNCCKRAVFSSCASASRMAMASALVNELLPITTFSINQDCGLIRQCVMVYVQLTNEVVGIWVGASPGLVDAVAVASRDRAVVTFGDGVGVLVLVGWGLFPWMLLG